VILKSKKNSLFIPLGIILIIFLTYIAANKNSFFQILKEDIVQLVMSIDPGFSHQSFIFSADLTANGESGDLQKNNKFISYIQAFPKIIDYKFNGIEFDRLDLDIPFLSYDGILKDRQRAIENILNSNPTKVPAKLRYMGKTYKSSIRLKGDSEDHWKSRYRMSLRVELKGDSTILGFKEFSIQKPHSRQFPYDYSYQSTLKALGNLSSAQKFVNLYVNGKSWGVMNVEEHMSKEFLEKQQRKESMIVKIGNEDKWVYNVGASEPYDDYLIASGAFNISPYGGKKYIQDLRYREILSYISKKQLHHDLDLYDANSLLSSYVLATLWAQWHTLLDTNHRYYFNPYTLKLESISADQDTYEVLDGLDSIGFSQLPIQFSKVLLSLEKNNQHLDSTILKIIEESLNFRYHFETASKYFPVNMPIQENVLEKNAEEFQSRMPYYLSPKPVDHRGFLFNDPSISSLELPTTVQASEFPEHIHFRHYSNGSLEIYNLLPDAVEINKIVFDGSIADDTKYIIPGYSQPLKPLIIETDFTGFYDQKVSILSSYQGFERESRNSYTLLFDRVFNPLLEDSFECSNLCVRDGQKYTFSGGSLTISKPIIIKGDVELLAGTHLSFSPNAYMIIEGSITSSGTLDKPVILDATEDYWKGLYIFNALKPSYLGHTKIKNLSALEDGLLKLTGAVTFYKADVDINNVEISDVISEDALNIISSRYSLIDNLFSETISDAFDSDFSEGVIKSTSFTNISGDAIDFSGSISLIDNVQINNIGDKGISVGEESFVTIVNSHLNNLRVGVISKDNSDVIIESSSITNFKSYGVMSFIKKDFYSSSSSIKMKGSILDKPLSFMRQKGTFMEIDSIEVEEQVFNVDKFYTSPIESL
jgi:hypothetical protein